MTRRNSAELLGPDLKGIVWLVVGRRHSSGRGVNRCAAGARLGSELAVTAFRAFTLELHAHWAYVISNNTITLTGYEAGGGSVTVPGTIEGLPVVGIASYAFRDNAS